MPGAAPLTSPPAEPETVEVYRRYPPAEILQMAVRPQKHPAPLSTPTSPVELVAPRNRSRDDTSLSSAAPQSSSSFTEALPEDESEDDEVRGSNTDNSESSHRRAEEREGERNANKIGDYKATVLSLTAPPSSSSTAKGISADVDTPQQEERPTEASTYSHISIRLRWGFEAADLRRVYELHEDTFPLSYAPTYYEWLLNHDACMALVATVTAETYAQWVDRTEGEEEEGDDVPLTWFPGYMPSPTEAIMGPRPVPPCAAKRPQTVETITERAEVDRMLAELEYRAEIKASEANEGRSNAHADPDASAYTQVIGFILGQHAYARHDAGHLLTNPTTYIGSFVVDPHFQRCGLGSALLQRFVMYATQQRPLYAQDYLHYNERKLIAMLAQAQLRKRSATWKTSGVGKHNRSNSNDKRHGDMESNSKKEIVDAAALSTSTTAGPSFFYGIVAAYLPEAAAWWEDRQARQRLRERGLSEDEIEAQRVSDRLAPDALTDEEADAVRRDAAHFLVQTGMREVWLHCLPGNRKATQLYAHRGFTLHRLLQDYYDVGKEKYDAFLLMYATPVAGTVVKDAGESDGGATHNSNTVSATAAAAAAAASNNPCGSLANAYWLSPRTYPSVADVILCSAEEGQKEWQERFGVPDANAARHRSWWGTAREVALLANAVCLFCAMVWLAYNVVLTGKVE